MREHYTSTILLDRDGTKLTLWSAYCSCGAKFSSSSRSQAFAELRKHIEPEERCKLDRSGCYIVGPSDAGSLEQR